MQAQDGVVIPKSTISPEGQITLPESVLEELSLKTGDLVRFLVYEGEVRVIPVRSLKQLFGALPYDGPPISLEEMNEAIASGACESAGAGY